MKTIVNMLLVLIAFTYLPLTWYMSYLVYKHIHATELMWFLFWMNIPFGFLTTLVSEIAKKLNK